MGWTGAAAGVNLRTMLTTSPRLCFALFTLGACSPEPAGTTTEETGDSEGTTSASTGTVGTSSGEVPTTGQGSTEAPTTGETTADTTGDETTGEPLTRVEQILAALDVAMYQCPDRIWPDVESNYRKRQVLLASQLENRAWLWNAQKAAGEPPVVSEGPLDSLPPAWASVFNIDFLGGALTLGISLDETAASNEAVRSGGGTVWPDFATSLAFHEGFHFLSDQDDWNTGNGDRAAPYPEPWEPRYLRAQLQSALYGEIMAPGSGLPAAAHWQARALAEHSEAMQAIRSYDCTEGSAEYASLMMSALAELGCEAGDPALLTLAASHLPDGIFINFAGFDTGREPYNLGVLAGQLLRRDAVAGWELKVEDGVPPVEQLLAGVTAVDQPDDPQVQADAQAAVAARNVKVGAEIDPLVAHMKDPAYTRMVFSYNWIAGAFQVGGFHYLADDPKTGILLTFSASLEPPSKVDIEITALTAFDQIATPCALTGNGAIVVAVPTADLTVVGGKADIASANLGFTGLAVEATVDGDALPWLCPVDGGGANGAVAPQPRPVLRTLPTHSGRQHVVRLRR